MDPRCSRIDKIYLKNYGWGGGIFHDLRISLNLKVKTSVKFSFYEKFIGLTLWLRL